MRLEQLLAGLTKRMGRSAPPPKGEDGRHVLEFNGDLRVSCEEVPGRGILLTCPVTELPQDADRAEALLRRLLKLSLPRMTTQRAVLCLDEQSRSVLLHRGLAADVDDAAFQEALEVLLNNLEFWRKNSGNEPAPSGPAASPLTFVYP